MRNAYPAKRKRFLVSGHCGVSDLHLGVRVLAQFAALLVQHLQDALTQLRLIVVRLIVVRLIVVRLNPLVAVIVARLHTAGAHPTHSQSLVAIALVALTHDVTQLRPDLRRQRPLQPHQCCALHRELTVPSIAPHLLIRFAHDPVRLAHTHRRLSLRQHLVEAEEAPRQAHQSPEFPKGI